MTASLHHQRIFSFVRRQGRITAAQKSALEKLWPKYGLSSEVLLEPEKVFGREAPLVLEIGFGMGQSLAAMAQADSSKNYIGIEVHRPGVGSLLNALEEKALSHVKVYCADAVMILKECIPPESLSEILIYFPDPWPKKRHHKRRLIQPDFIKIILSCLKPGGILHCATDWKDYAEQMMAVLSGFPDLVNTSGEGVYADRPAWRPETKFEKRGQRLGHGIWDLVFQRRKPS